MIAEGCVAATARACLDKGIRLSAEYLADWKGWAEGLEEWAENEAGWRAIYTKAVSRVRTLGLRADSHDGCLTIVDQDNRRSLAPGYRLAASASSRRVCGRGYDVEHWVRVPADRQWPDWTVSRYRTTVPGEREYEQVEPAYPDELVGCFNLGDLRTVFIDPAIEPVLGRRSLIAGELEVAYDDAVEDIEDQLERYEDPIA